MSDKKLVPQVPGETSQPVQEEPVHAPAKRRDPTPEEQAALDSQEADDVAALKADNQRMRVLLQEHGGDDPTAHLPTHEEALKQINAAIQAGEKPRAILSKKGWVVPPGEKPKLV